MRSAVRAVANGKGGRWASRGGVDLIEAFLLEFARLKIGKVLAEPFPMRRLPVLEIHLPDPATEAAVVHAAAVGDGITCRQTESRESKERETERASERVSGRERESERERDSPGAAK